MKDNEWPAMSRRRLITASAVTLGTASLFGMTALRSASAADTTEASGMSHRLDPSDGELLDATAQAELVRCGRVSPRELVEQAIERIERLNPELNAVIIPRFEKVRAEAARVKSGPFRGVPYLLKDITMGSEGDPHSASIAGVKAAGYRADHDSYFVQRMRAAGFILVGKTNTPELGIQSTTEPVAWGPSRNPWDTTRSSGASSGGSAAAVGAGMVAVAHGNDSGGSIRMPGSHCGVVGLKSTRGRISQGPTVMADNISGMAHEGLLTRSVRDAAAVLDIVGGHHPGDGYAAPTPRRPYLAEVGADPDRLRIGVLTEDPMGELAVAAECVTAARTAADALAGLGHNVTDGFPPALREANWPLEFMPCVAVSMLRELEHYGRLIGRPLTETDVEPATWAMAEMGRQVTAYSDHRDRSGPDRHHQGHQGGPVLQGHGQPVHVHRAVQRLRPAGDLTAAPHQRRRSAHRRATRLAAYGREDLLFAVSAQLEAAMPWADRRPPVSA